MGLSVAESIPSVTMDADRLRKLEEAQLFTDHTLEQLSLEVRDLGERITELAALIARVEARLQTLSEPDDPDSAQE